MALALDAQGLYSEIEKAREHRDRFIGTTYEDTIQKYVGPGYRRTFTGDVDFDNHAYKWISLFLPILASGNPRIRAKTPRQGSASALCKAIEFGVNRNFELTNAKRLIEQLATDWAFKWCVALTTPQPILGMLEVEDPPYRPVTRRLSIMDYIWDPLAIGHAECRYQAHRIIRDKDSLLREADEMPERGWDPSAIESIHMTPDRDKRGEKLQETYDRDEVEFWEIWVPEAELESAKDDRGKKFIPRPEMGYHGTIYTICKDTLEFIRDPRPYWGPREGPYTFSGYLYVPDRVVPLSPLAANAAQQEIYNSVWAACVEAIKNFKSGVAVSSQAAGDLAEKIREFEDQEVFVIEGIGEDIDKMVRDIQKGGLTPNHIPILQLLSANLENSSGLSQARQGNPSTGATATADSIAKMSGDQRMGYMSEKFNSSVTKPIARKEAFYLALHPKSRIPLGPLADGVFVDMVTGEPIEYPVLAGGMANADIMEDMDIEIEPIAQRATSELLEAEISAQQDAWIATFGPLMPQMPWIEWDQVIAKKAEQWRDPSWARVINTKKAMMFGMMMTQMNLSGVPGGITQPQPRLGVDTQPRQALKSSEQPAGFSRNARPAQNAAQSNKAPRAPGASKETHSMTSKVNK